MIGSGEIEPDDHPESGAENGGDLVHPALNLHVHCRSQSGNDDEDCNQRLSVLPYQVYFTLSGMRYILLLGRCRWQRFLVFRHASMHSIGRFFDRGDAHGVQVISGIDRPFPLPDPPLSETDEPASVLIVWNRNGINRPS